MTDQIYRKGAPVEIDVNRLMDAIGVPDEGTIITHHNIEDITGLSRKDSRYGTVVKTWRQRLLREHNILLVGRPGIGLLAADPGDRVRWASGRAESGKRAILRAAHVAATTDLARLDGVQRATVDHVTMLAAKMVPLGAVRKKIDPPKPAQDTTMVMAA